MSSLEVELEGLVLGERQQERGQVAREEQARVRRHGGRQIERRQDRDAVLDDRLAGRDSSQLPPPSAARSTITEPGCIARTIVGGDQPGREHAADERGGDHDVGRRALLGEQLPLAGLVLLGELLGVAAAGRGALA